MGRTAHRAGSGLRRRRTAGPGRTARCHQWRGTGRGEPNGRASTPGSSDGTHRFLRPDPLVGRWQGRESGTARTALGCALRRDLPSARVSGRHGLRTAVYGPHRAATKDGR